MSWVDIVAAGGIGVLVGAGLFYAIIITAFMTGGRW
jgi:hypothetical protein